MTKQEFIDRLKRALASLPATEIDSRAAFYGEMIDDRMEEGCSEEDAVLGVGSPEEIAAQILKEMPVTNEKRAPKSRLNSGQLLLLVLGSPLWLSLLIAAFAVVFSLYVTIWSLLVSLWAVFISFLVSGICTFIIGIYCLFVFPPIGLVSVGTGLILTGLGIMLFFATNAATSGTVLLSKNIAKRIRGCFAKKEVVS